MLQDPKLSSQPVVENTAELGNLKVGKVFSFNVLPSFCLRVNKIQRRDGPNMCKGCDPLGENGGMPPRKFEN